MRYNNLLILFLFTLFISSILVLPGNSLAAGYGIYEWSARGNALGGALVGRADDPSAVAFNPAGIVQLEGTQTMAGLSLVVPNSDVVVKNPYTNKKATFDGKLNIWTIPHLYLTKQLSEKYWFGLGVFSRAGLGTEYKDQNWWGRYSNTYTGIKQSGLNPNLAMRLADNLSFAVGFEISWLDFEHEKAIDYGKQNNPTNTTRDVKLNIHGDTIGYGGNIALRYTPAPWLTAGLSYRTKISMSVDGKATFDLPAGVPGPVKGLFKNCNVKGTAPIPEMLALGLTLFPTENLSLEFDTVLTRWSAYKDLTFEFDSPLRRKSSVKNWKDSWRFQLGAEYALSDALAFQASYVFDQSPVTGNHVDYIVPANDRHLFGLGAGYHQDNWSLDVGYTWLMVEARDVKARVGEGVLDSRFENGMSHIGSLSFTYKF